MPRWEKTWDSAERDYMVSAAWPAQRGWATATFHGKKTKWSGQYTFHIPTWAPSFRGDRVLEFKFPVMTVGLEKLKKMTLEEIDYLSRSYFLPRHARGRSRVRWCPGTLTPGRKGHHATWLADNAWVQTSAFKRRGAWIAIVIVMRTTGAFDQEVVTGHRTLEATKRAAVATARKILAGDKKATRR